MCQKKIILFISFFTQACWICNAGSAIRLVKPTEGFFQGLIKIFQGFPLRGSSAAGGDEVEQFLLHYISTWFLDFHTSSASFLGTFPSSGRLIELYGMDYNGNGYYGFIKNLQGDIVSIVPLDSESNVELNMEYNSWGKPIFKQESSPAEGNKKCNKKQ